jgi:hypothetical protein
MRTIGWLAIVAASLTACSRWQVQSLAPEALLAERHPDRIRITRADRTTIVLRAPKVSGDTVYGSLREGPDTAARPEAVALADVAQVETRKLDPVATGALTLGSAAVIAGTVVVLWLTSVASD